MIHFCPATIFMSIVSCNIIIIALTLVFSNTKCLIHSNGNIYKIVILAIYIRLLLPFSFFHTRNYYYANQGTVDKIKSFLLSNFIYIGSYGLSIMKLVFLIWIVGIIANIITCSYHFLQTRRFIMNNHIDVTKEYRYASIVNHFCVYTGKKNNYRVYKVPGISIPMIYGIHNPIVLLPSEIEYATNDLYFILLHELYHSFHNDIAYLFFGNLIKILFWFNPACPILTNQLLLTLEMRIDNIVSDIGPKAVSAYLNCIIRIMESNVHSKETRSINSLAMATYPSKQMTLRFVKIINKKKELDKFSLIPTFIITFLIVMFIIGSYVHTIDSHHANMKTSSSVSGFSYLDDGFSPKIIFLRNGINITL